MTPSPIVRLGLVLTAACFALSSATVSAQSFYLNFPGSPIKGGATAPGHEDWIELNSYSHQISNQFIVGNGAPGRPMHSPILITKTSDAASIALIEALNKGTRLQSAEFEATRQAGGNEVVYFRVVLDGAYLTSFSIAGVAGDPFAESLSIVYEKITLTFWELDANGNQIKSHTTSYDVLNNTTPLAAQMANLRVQADGNDVIFGWQTLSETGNYGFEVQHLEDGEFRRAAYVPATGWSDLPLEYQVRVRGLDEGIHIFRVASLSLGGGATYSAELTVALGVPDGVTLALDSPYPNPLNDVTNIAVSVARDEHVRVSVFDVVGREVAVVHDGILESGSKSRFRWDRAAELPAGTYFVRAKSDRGVATRAVTVAH